MFWLKSYVYPATTKIFCCCHNELYDFLWLATFFGACFEFKLPHFLMRLNSYLISDWIRSSDSKAFALIFKSSILEVCIQTERYFCEVTLKCRILWTSSVPRSPYSYSDFLELLLCIKNWTFSSASRCWRCINLNCKHKLNVHSHKYKSHFNFYLKAFACQNALNLKS